MPSWMRVRSKYPSSIQAPGYLFRSHRAEDGATLHIATRTPLSFGTGKKITGLPGTAHVEPSVQNSTNDFGRVSALAPVANPANIAAQQSILISRPFVRFLFSLHRNR